MRTKTKACATRIPRLFAPLACALVCAGAQAAAITLEPATFFELVGVGGNSAGGFPVSLVPGSETVNEPAGYARGTGTATATTTNVLPLLTTGSVVLSGKDSVASYGGTASAKINFQFALEALPGGSTGTLVPVDITTRGLVMLRLTAGAAGAAPGNASARVYLPGVLSHVASRVCSGNVSDGVSCSSADGESFDSTLATSLREGTVYDGELSISLHAQGGGLGFTTDAHAMVDPAIVIQAPFADQYRVVFSPGLVAVPLPATLPLLLSMVAGLSLVRRDDRSRASRNGVRALPPPRMRWIVE